MCNVGFMGTTARVELISVLGSGYLRSGRVGGSVSANNYTFANRLSILVHNMISAAVYGALVCTATDTGYRLHHFTRR